MIQNKSNKTILAKKNVKFLTNSLQHATGLMFAPKMDEFAYIFVFNTMRHIPIHMNFVFFPIDAVWLDTNKKVVAVEKNIQPWTQYVDPKVKAQYLVELPINSSIKTGDILEF